jgi:hypothetical protein
MAPQPLRRLRASGLELLSDLKPWDCIATKELSLRLKVDAITVALWRYRGLAPPCIPDAVTVGRVNAYLVADYQAWLAPATSPLDRFRQALTHHIGDEALTCSTDLLAIYAMALAEKSEAVGFTFARGWRKNLQAFVRSRINDYENTK